MRILKALQVSLCVTLLCAALAAAAAASDWDKKTVVTFGDSVEVPGQILPAGTYVFKLLNSPASRHVVQIWNEDESQLVTTIMTIPDYRSDVADEPTFDFEERPGDSPMALHSWFYPGAETGEQFVYPHWH